MTKYNEDGSLNMENFANSIRLTVYVSTEHENKGTKIKIEREACIESRDLTFKAVDKFNKELDKINKLLKAAIKENRLTTMWVGCSNHGLNKKYGTNGFTDSWQYRGWAGDDNACAIECNDTNGFVLNPDLRYTQCRKAMFYDFTLKSLHGVLTPEDSEKEKRHETDWRQENEKWQRFMDKQITYNDL